MFQQKSHPTYTASTHSLKFFRLWEVWGDHKYGVFCNRPNPRKHIAVWTLSGCGEVTTSNNPPLLQHPNHLSFFRIKDITRYRCSAVKWYFRWFEFEIQDKLPLPLNTPIKIGISQREEEDFRLFRDTINHTGRASGLLGTSRFSILFHNWVAAYHDQTQTRDPADEQLETLIQKLNNTAEYPWRIAEMAHEMGVSERHFRMLFKQYTGQSPKRYFDTLRMEHAHQMLIFTNLTITEISEHFSFSSPFHFSQMYARHFGRPPSKARKQPQDEF